MEEVEQIIEKLTEDWEYNKMSLINKLFNYYKVNVDGNADLNELAKSYGISNLQSMKINDRNKRLELIEFLYGSIKDKLAHSLPPPPSLSPEEAQTRIPKYIDSDEYRENQKQLAEKQKLIEEQQRQIEELKQKLEEETRKNKVNFSKLIVDGINNWHEEVFKPSHEELSYDEYIEKTKENNKKIKEVIDEINRNQDKLIVNFEQFDDKGKEQIKETILNWLGKQPKINHFLIHYRVGDMWKSATLNIDGFKKLKERLNDNGLIYDMEKTPTWTYDADNKSELPEWSLFSEIRILSFKPNFKTYKDNGGHFFEYLNNSPQFIRVNEYFKRLQIFDKLSLDGKKQREELNDCCLIYALKMSGLCDEELNLMRLRIKTRYLSFKSLKELCQQFHFKIVKHKIDEEAKGKNKTKNEILAQMKLIKQFIYVNITTIILLMN